MHKAFLSQHLHMEIVFPIPPFPSPHFPSSPSPCCCFSRCLRDMSVDLLGTSTCWYYMSRLPLSPSETQFLCSFTSRPFHSSPIPACNSSPSLPPSLSASPSSPFVFTPSLSAPSSLSPFFTYISQSLFEWRSAVVVCCCRLSLFLLLLLLLLL